jgi:hypothetical protein
LARSQVETQRDTSSWQHSLASARGGECSPKAVESCKFQVDAAEHAAEKLSNPQSLRFGKNPHVASQLLLTNAVAAQSLRFFHVRPKFAVYFRV